MVFCKIIKIKKHFLQFKKYKRTRGLTASKVIYETINLQIYKSSPWQVKTVFSAYYNKS